MMPARWRASEQVCECSCGPALGIRRAHRSDRRGRGREARASRVSWAGPRRELPGAILRVTPVRAGVSDSTEGAGSAAKQRVLVVEGDSRLGSQVARALQEDPAFEVHVTPSSSDPSATDDVSARKPHAVVSCIDIQGPRLEDLTVYTKNRNVIDAAVLHGVRRFVLVSSIGAGDSEQALPGPAKDAMRPLMSIKRRAEAYLEEKAGEIEYTILRLAPLNDDAGDGEVGSPLLTESPGAYGQITARGAGELVRACLASASTVGATLSAVDKETIFCTNPFLRPLETHETMPFEEFIP